jgi:hypothetical protein
VVVVLLPVLLVAVLLLGVPVVPPFRFLSLMQLQRSQPTKDDVQRRPQRSSLQVNSSMVSRQAGFSNRKKGV